MSSTLSMLCPNLNQFLKQHPSNSTRLIGLGNMDRGDDAAGIVLCQKLKPDTPQLIFHEQEKTVESLIVDFVEDPLIQCILFIDAVDFSGKAGQARCFFPEEIKKLVLPVSTHKPPIQILCNLIIQHQKNCCLLGIQPNSLNLFEPMSIDVQNTISSLEHFFHAYYKT